MLNRCKVKSIFAFPNFNLQIGLARSVVSSNPQIYYSPLNSRSTSSWTVEDVNNNYDLAKSALLFPGQGAQHVGMGLDIYKEYSVAKEVLDEAEEVVGGGLKKLMFDGPQTQLTSTENAQPAILAHSIALLRVLESEFEFDVTSCSYAMGHSLGEYSALVATRSLTLLDAIQLVHVRGQLMHETTKQKKTAMKALVITAEIEQVEDNMEKIQRSLPDGEVVAIANINSSAQVVLSGTSFGVEYASSIIQGKGLAGRSISLPVSGPFHCSLMDSAAEKMKRAIEGVKFLPPVIDVISNVTGQPFNDAREIPELLVKQMTNTVQWLRSVQYARSDDVSDWIVVGPSRVISNLLKKDYPLDEIRSFSTVADLKAFGSRLKRV
ncbi:hypothetical protein HK098_005614 [Nowakowskiella sp. JEL0407]|nr:hypothetical protein HK098_005614 [Nowakowskiella sp. JEL0407]